MLTKKLHILTLFALLGILFSAQGAFCDAIKDRMLARLPVINELKAQGLVGENNQGLLEFRTVQKPQADVVNAENQDRKEVYKAIAARQKTTPEFVGQARAAQIAGKESGGTWVQGADGAWKQK